MSRLGPCCLLLTLTLYTGSLSAQSGLPAVEGWLYLEVEDVVLVGNVDAATLEGLGQALLALRQTLHQLTPDATFRGAGPTHLVVFRDHATFLPYTLAEQEANTVGYLIPQASGNYGAFNISAGKTPAHLIHKLYAHEFFHRNLPELPRWFRGGLAELYSTFTIDQDRALIGLPIQHIALGPQAHGAPPAASAPEDTPAGPPAPTPYLLGIRALLSTPEEWDVGKGLADDQQSWLLVHYLVLGSELRRDQTRTFLRQIASGAAAEVSFREAYGIEPTELGPEVEAYRLAGELPYYQIPLGTLQRLTRRAEPLAAHQVLHHLGDLLHHAVPQRPGQAAEHFRAALSRHEGYGPSHASLGELAFQHQDLPLAQHHLQRAVELMPDDARARYLYGSVLLQPLRGQRTLSPEQLAQLALAQQELRRSTELAPDLAGAWEHLGYAYNLDPKPTPAAVAACQRASELLPDRPDVTFNLLLAQARTGDRTAVAASRERLVQQGASPDLLRRATEMALQLDFAAATRLVRQNRPADAIAWLAHVRAHTTSPELRQQAEEWIVKVEAADAKNRFAQLYQEAISHWQAGDVATALALADALAATARPGPQQEIVEQLRRELAAPPPVP